MCCFVLTLFNVYDMILVFSLLRGEFMRDNYDLFDKYEVMDCDFEYEQGVNLKNREQLTIVDQDDKALFPRLKLGKILGSIVDETQLEVLKKLKKLPYLLNDDNLFKDELPIIKRYLKLCEDGFDRDVLISSFSNLDYSSVISVQEYYYQIGLLIDYVIAKNNFYRRNIGLVKMLANKQFYNNVFSYEDIVQEGNIGLIKAINKYDVDFGVRFGTYAGWWINQEMSRSYNCYGSVIRKPVYLNEKINQYKIFARDFVVRNNREPSLEESASYLGMSCADVEQLVLCFQEVISLSSLVNPEENDDKVELVDFVESDVVLEDMVVDGIMREYSLELMNGCLKDREVKILCDRFGINEEQVAYSRLKIGKKYNLSRERVRQLELRSISKLKSIMEVKMK